MSSTDSYRSRLQDENKASDYASRFERGPRRRINEREQRAVRKIFSTLSDCRTVLDVPCGAGRFLASLTQGQRQVTEMDMAAEVLEHSRQRARDLGIEAKFLQGDASKIPLPDNGVDAVFCNRLLHHITSANERAVFLREFARVTRRHLVISFFDYRAFGGLRCFLKKLKGRKVDYRGQPTLSEFKAEVEQAGFSVLSIVMTGPLWVSQKYFVLEKNSFAAVN
jgi:SAM-dependent methyltransferase